MKRWLSSVYQVIAMTKVLEIDVDVSEIKLILFSRSSYGVVEFTQQYE